MNKARTSRRAASQSQEVISMSVGEFMKQENCATTTGLVNYNKNGYAYIWLDKANDDESITLYLSKALANEYPMIEVVDEDTGEVSIKRTSILQELKNFRVYKNINAEGELRYKLGRVRAETLSADDLM